MKRILLCFILLVCFPHLGCGQQQKEQAASASSAAAEGRIDPNTWDFGDVKAGEVLRHDFLLKNESLNILRIKEINTSCGCTVSEVKQKILQPQEETLIEVKFNSQGYKGAVKQFIYVHTDNLDNPVLRYIIKANVVS